MLGHLPVEITYKIIEYLDVKDILNYFSINRRHQGLNNSLLWKRLLIRDFDYYLDDGIMCYKKFHKAKVWIEHFFMIDFNPQCPIYLCNLMTPLTLNYIKLYGEYFNALYLLKSDIKIIRSSNGYQYTLDNNVYYIGERTLNEYLSDLRHKGYRQPRYLSYVQSEINDAVNNGFFKVVVL